METYLDLLEEKSVLTSYWEHPTRTSSKSLLNEIQKI